MTEQEIEALCEHLETTAKLIAERFPNWAALNRTALTAIRQLQQPWRPIESAPRDGTEVLVFNRATGWYVSQYDNGEWPKHGWDNKPGVWYPVPSNWQPLPTPPETGQ